MNGNSQEACTDPQHGQGVSVVPGIRVAIKGNMVRCCTLKGAQDYDDL